MQTIFIAIKIRDNSLRGYRPLDTLVERLFKENNPEMLAMAASSDPEVIVDWASTKSYADKKKITDNDWACVALCDISEEDEQSLKNECGLDVSENQSPKC